MPDAFGARALSFAAAYVFMQVGRTLFMLKALRGYSPGNFRNFRRIAVWLVLSGVFWIAGALLPETARPACWIVALFLEYISPAVGFWTPGLGRSTTADWMVEGHHLAERCALFVVIALGESVLVTDATFAELDWTLVTAAAFRIAYTYIHLFIVAGIIVSAVADELILTRPTADCDAKSAAVMPGGMGLYLIGNALFKSAVAGRIPLSHLIGLFLLALEIPLAPIVSVLAFGFATTLVLVAVVAWDMLASKQKHQS